MCFEMDVVAAQIAVETVEALSLGGRMRHEEEEEDEEQQQQQQREEEEDEEGEELWPPEVPLPVRKPCHAARFGRQTHHRLHCRQGYRRRWC